MADHHCERVWLNGDDSSSTGSVVAFDGPARWGDVGNGETTVFLEVADCHVKTRLHKSSKDTTADFLAKMKRLHGVIGRFIEHLERKEAKENGRH